MITFNKMVREFFILGFLTFLCLNLVESANILAIIPTPVYSHQVAHAEIWAQLSLRGHQVTVLTSHPQNRPELTNLTEISLASADVVLEEKRSAVDLEKLSSLECMKKLYDFFNHVSDHILSKPEVRDLIENKENRKFDVIIVEYLYPEYLAFGEVYNAPTIAIGSMDIPKHFHDVFGNPTHPIIYPTILLPLNGELTFAERILSTIFTLYYEHFRESVIYEGRQQLLNKHFKNVSKTIDGLTHKISMSFINVNPVLAGNRPLAPATVIVGGGNHIQPPKPLPKDIKDFLDSAKAGAIYFSLGSSFQTNEVDKSMIDTIISTLEELPYKVLWKFELKNLENLPKNVKLLDWAPQQDILRHPNIKAFVTQGGIQSLDEAVHAKVPMVGVPIYADQKHNARRMTRKGIMIEVPREPSLDKETLKNAILEVVNNPSYKQKLEELLRITLDQPMTGMEKAIWWTEYVIRHQGAEHLWVENLNIPFYQYYFLDVIGFVIAVLTLVLGLVGVLIFGVVRVTKIVYGKIFHAKQVSRKNLKKKIS